MKSHNRRDSRHPERSEGSRFRAEADASGNVEILRSARNERITPAGGTPAMMRQDRLTGQPPL